MLLESSMVQRKKYSEPEDLEMSFNDQKDSFSSARFSFSIYKMEIIRKHSNSVLL